MWGNEELRSARRASHLGGGEVGHVLHPASDSCLTADTSPVIPSAR
jgi:hypothetical protein